MAKSNTLTRIRAGKYATEVTHHGCGGQIEIESVGSGEWKWESYCARCLSCDPNGWRTLKEAASEAVAYFGPPESPR